MPADTSDLMRFAHELADRARPIAQGWFRRRDSGLERKADDTPVTRADRDIEAALREHIGRHHPSHGIYGEEHGQERLDAEFVWVIDPIDGTKAFASGNPLFGTLIGLWHDGAPLLGVFDAPALGERYHARVGHGAYRDNERLTTNTTTGLADAVLYCTTPDLLLDHAGHRRLRSAARWTSYGADCHAYGLLAAGGCDLIVDTTLQPYDWCALVPIVEEAGGVVTDWRGQPMQLDGDGSAIAAATATLAAAARATMHPGAG